MDARINLTHDAKRAASLIRQSSTGGHGAGVTFNFASSAAMRAFSASFSSRASRAMSLTASNSSRLTMSRSRRIFSAWLRTTVSTSRLTPWAAAAASFIRRPISSKNRLLVWVIAKNLRSAANCQRNHTMAIWTAQFKADDPPKALIALSCSGFLAIVSTLRRQPESQQVKKRHDRPTDRDSHQGRPHHHFHHPSRARRPASRHHFLHGRACNPRGTSRHGAPARHLGLLRDAAQYVLPLRRHGAWAAAGRSRIPRAQAHVPADGLDQHSPGNGGYKGVAGLCRRSGRRAQGY